jgi:hypothetical protein
MKKTLLIAAAALAAGVISSQAQVYSQNIVGYVNQSLPTGFTLIANPLDATGGNNVTNVISNPTGALDGSKIYLWTGTTFTVYTIDSTVSSGVADAGDVNPVFNVTLNPGQALFFNNTVGSTATNTYTGTVHVEAAGPSTNVVGVTTNVLSTSPAFSLVASKIAVGGGVSSVLGLANPTGALDGSRIYVPKIVAGNVKGYTVTTIDSTVTGGFADAGDVNPAPEPVIPVGSGFFFDNTIGGNVTWIQSF